MNEVYFPALFPGFPLPEELAEALGRLAIVHAELDRETRTIRLDAQAEQYLAEKQLQALCRDIEKEYGLRELKLSVRYPASELPNMDFRDLAQVFIRAFSPSAAILAGAGYEVTDEAGDAWDAAGDSVADAAADVQDGVADAKDDLTQN